MAFLLSVAQFVLIDELTGLYHHHLLDESSKLTTARLLDCEKNYCDYSYEVNGQILEQKIRNPYDTTIVGDSIRIHYHPKNPNIFRLARSTNSD